MECQVGTHIEHPQKVFRYNRCHSHMELQPSVLRKKLMRKARKVNTGRFIKKTESSPTLPNMLNDRIELVLNGEHAAGAVFMNIVDCLQAGGGYISSNKLTFTM